jgi:hypothetical protein
MIFHALPLFFDRGTNDTGGIQMRKNLAAVVIGFLIIGLFFMGCTVNKATTKATNFDKKPIELAGGRPFEVLGPVSLQKAWYGVLGYSFGGIQTPYITLPPKDNYLYQVGGVTYVDLLEHAETLYSGVDAVVDINVDYLGNEYWVFYAKRNHIVSGIAIRYVKEPSPPSAPTLELKIK